MVKGDTQMDSKRKLQLRGAGIGAAGGSGAAVAIGGVGVAAAGTAFGLGLMLIPALAVVGGLAGYAVATEIGLSKEKKTKKTDRNDSL